jgi:tetratricopeptide (TPR) repeat protein
VQQTIRVKAVDALRAINTPAASAALLDLMDSRSLPDDIAATVRNAAAQKLNQQALEALKGGRLDEAMRTAERAVDADDTFAEAHGILGEVLYKQNHLDKALDEFRSAVARKKNDPWAYYMQAVILGSRKEYRAAERAARSAIRTNPSYPWSYRLLVELYHDQDRDTELASLLRDLQKEHPQVAEIYVQLAFVYHERLAGRNPASYESAYEANRQLLNLVHDSDPEQALSAEMNLLECRLTTGRYHEVLQNAPALLARVGNDADNQLSVHLLMLAAEVLLRQDRDALTTLDQARRIYDDNFKSRGRWHNWVYDGTQRYVATHHPDDARTRALAELIRAINGTSSVRQADGDGDGVPPAISGEVFDSLRSALDSAGRAAPLPRATLGSE